MRAIMHPLAQEYLVRLSEAARVLPPQDRDELLAELQSHLDSGSPANATDADVRNMLSELGSPEDIVAAAHGVSPNSSGGAAERQPTEVQSCWGALEITAILCISLGTLVAPVVGPIVGLGLVWASKCWSRSVKLVLTVLAVFLTAIVAGGLFAVATGGISEVGDPVRIGLPAEFHPSVPWPADS